MWNTSANKNGYKYTKCEVVKALQTNNLGNDKPRVPYYWTIEHFFYNYSNTSD